MRDGESGQRVVFVLESKFPIEIGGGAEGQVRTLGVALQSRGIPVEVVAPMVPYGSQVEHDSVDGLRVWRISYPKVRIVGGIVMLSRLAWYLIRRRRRYDAIHAHIAHNMAAVACVVGRLLGKPVVVKITGWLEMQRGILSDRDVRLTAWARRAAVRRAAYYQATSQEIAHLLERYGFERKKIVRIPNAVDLSRFSPDAAQRDRNSSAPARPLTGVFVGRLVPEKGLDTLISAWRQTFDTTANVQLTIVGDGPLRGTLENQVSAGCRQHQIKFVGRSQQVEQYLAESDFGLLPSLYEGLSNTLLEYMSSGLPVIGSRISGTQDLIQHRVTGWLVEPGSVADMETCLREVASLDGPRRRQMGRAGRERVAELAGIRTVSDRLLQLYGFAC
jgi:glycosyltransferase involved in cell wall biosynthesis